MDLANHCIVKNLSRRVLNNCTFSRHPLGGGQCSVWMRTTEDQAQWCQGELVDIPRSSSGRKWVNDDSNNVTRYYIC